MFEIFLNECIPKLLDLLFLEHEKKKKIYIYIYIFLLNYFIIYKKNFVLF